MDPVRWILHGFKGALVWLPITGMVKRFLLLREPWDHFHNATLGCTAFASSVLALLETHQSWDWEHEDT